VAALRDPQADQRCLAALAAAVALHALIALSAARGAPGAREPPALRARSVIDFELERPRPLPVPVAAAVPERAAQVQPATSTARRAAPAASSKAAARAPPALQSPPQAESALAASPEPELAEPVDFTSNDFVIGARSIYAGRPSGADATKADTPSPAFAAEASDRSRRASVLGSDEWQCPFPQEANDDQIDHAVVSLRVDVDANGGVRQLAIVEDPGHGFAREALHCARSKHWSPALDRAGNPSAGTLTVHIRFER